MNPKDRRFLTACLTVLVLSIVIGFGLLFWLMKPPVPVLVVCTVLLGLLVVAMIWSIRRFFRG